jgi:hypothetical protein
MRFWKIFNPSLKLKKLMLNPLCPSKINVNPLPPGPICVASFLSSYNFEIKDSTFKILLLLMS